MKKKRVLSGIRATGRLHLGNYLGMVKGMVALQGNPDYEPLFMVADLHAMTTPFDPQILKKNIREVVLDYLAAGLDPKSAILFIQSQVPQHVELAYLFSTVVSIARLSHLPTYKEKVKQYPESNTIALLYYPVLMASDILLYKTNSLPVGDDQLPHLEVTGEVAKKMNNLYGTDFPEPKQMKTEGHYVPSLTGEGKMSKSVEGSYINLTDDLETIKQRLAKAPTDSGIIGGDVPKQGGVANLFALLKLLANDTTYNKFVQEYRDKKIKYVEMKDILAAAVYKELQPLQEKRKHFEENPKMVDELLEESNKKCLLIAEDSMREVKEKMGLL